MATLTPPPFSGCSLYTLKLDGAPTPSDYTWSSGQHESFHLKILGFCCQHIYILSCIYLSSVPAALTKFLNWKEDAEASADRMD